jgi:cytochrome P450
MKPVFGPNVVYDAEPVRRSEQMKAMANGLRVSRLQAYVPKIEAEVKFRIRSSLSLHKELFTFYRQMRCNSCSIACWHQCAANVARITVLRDYTAALLLNDRQFVTAVTMIKYSIAMTFAQHTALSLTRIIQTHCCYYCYIYTSMQHCYRLSHSMLPLSSTRTYLNYTTTLLILLP